MKKTVRIVERKSNAVRVTALICCMVLGVTYTIGVFFGSYGLTFVGYGSLITVLLSAAIFMLGATQ